jgi:hypothetical protein
VGLVWSFFFFFFFSIYLFLDMKAGLGTLWLGSFFGHFLKLDFYFFGRGWIG